MKNNTNTKRQGSERDTEPNVVTPIRDRTQQTQTTSTHNQYSTLTTDTDSEATIAEEAFLPTNSANTLSESDSDLDMSTDASDTYHMITMTKLLCLMEELEPVSIAINSKYTYTNIGNFQITMSNALARVPAPYEAHGYSYLADTDEAYFNRANQQPPGMPTMPAAPDYSDKAQVRTVKRTLKHYQACANIKAIGIKALSLIHI